MTVFLVTQERLSLSNLRDAWLNPFTVEISDAARERIELSNRKIAEVLDGGDQVYGVNTGFGLLANVRVSNDELDHLQDNIIRSHAVGVGERPEDLRPFEARAFARGLMGLE